MLSLVAVLAAWSGDSAAEWGTEASVRLAKASAMRTEANRALGTATQIRIFDSVSFNAVVTAYTSGDPAEFRLAARRLRPGYRAAFTAWLATHPLKNPHAPPDPSYLPQYRIPQEAQGRALDAKAETFFKAGQAAGATVIGTSGSRSCWPPCCSSSGSAGTSRCARRAWACSGSRVSCWRSRRSGCWTCRDHRRERTQAKTQVGMVAGRARRRRGWLHAQDAAAELRPRHLPRVPCLVRAPGRVVRGGRRALVDLAALRGVLARARGPGHRRRGRALRCRRRSRHQADRGRPGPARRRADDATGGRARQGPRARPDRRRRLRRLTTSAGQRRTRTAGQAEGRLATPRALQGSGEWSPTKARSLSRTRNVRSIATGFSPPKPPRTGSSRTWMRSIVATITAITENMSAAWAYQRSPLSAKNRTKPKMTAAMKNSVTHRGPGMTPAAPWVRSARACSRSAVRSRYLS